MWNAPAHPTCDAVEEEAPGAHPHPLVEENIVDRAGRGVRLPAIHGLGHKVYKKKFMNIVCLCLKSSVSDPKRLFPDPDPTLKGIPDPDPTLQGFPDPFPDPGQNSTF